MQEGGDIEFDFPRPVRWLIRHVACPVAKVFGYRALYPEYRSHTKEVVT